MTHLSICERGESCRAFDADPAGTYQLTAESPPPLLGRTQPPWPRTQRARMRSLDQAGSPTVLIGPARRAARTGTDATITMGAVCARIKDTGPDVAEDPRRVVTLLDPGLVEALLRKYGLQHDWEHVVKGLRDGFDVGIRECPSHTRIFQKPRLFSPRPIVHKFI